MTVWTGTLRAPGRRTGGAALRLRGEADNAQGHSFPPVRNRARWSPLAARRGVLPLIVDSLRPADAAIEIAIDEPGEQRWGPQIPQPGHSRDRALSSRTPLVRKPRTAWDGDGGRRAGAWEQTAVGRAGHDPRGQ